MAYIAVLELRLDPDRLDEGRVAVADLVATTRDSPGNIAVDVVPAENDPARLVVVESWASAEADHAYRAFRAQETGPRALAGFLTAAPSLVKGAVDAAI